jgi:hypothetical protein
VFSLYRQNKVLNTVVYSKPWFFRDLETPLRTPIFFSSLYMYFVFSNETKQILVLSSTVVLLW